jgi:hypothetical protein
MSEIVIKPMYLKELCVLCQCSYYQLRAQLKATAKAHKEEFKGFNFSRAGKKTLSKKQVKIFLTHSDMLPETITL